MSTTMTTNQDVHSVMVIKLLAGLGFDDARCDGRLDVAIDRFDQWTNPESTGLLCTSCLWVATESALERAM